MRRKVWDKTSAAQRTTPTKNINEDDNADLAPSLSTQFKQIEIKDHFAGYGDWFRLLLRSIPFHSPLFPQIKKLAIFLIIKTT